MVFKRLLGSLGVGGPSVETVLEGGAVRPGGTLRGEVRLAGGSMPYDIERVSLELVARVEAEHGQGEDGESEGLAGFGRYEIGGGFRLGEEDSYRVPFAVTLPWETPVTELHGEPLGITLGVRTELEVAGARDKGDFDLIAVRPLAVQEAVLEAFGQLGFGFRSADLELGHINGSGQQLPFYQEIELIPAPGYAHRLNEIEVTFLAHAGGAEVVLEADGRGGAGGSGADDALSRHSVGHEGVVRTDWNAVVAGWIDQLAAHGSYEGHGHESHQGHESHHGHSHSSGSGMSTGAAVAVGVAGGMVAAEVVDEVGDFFEGDEEEEAEG